MKNLLLITAILFSNFAMAQKAISVTETNEQINNSSYNSLSVTVYNGQADDVKKAWKKQLKDLKGKVSDKKELFADDCELKEMGDNTFDVYSRVDEIPEVGAKLIVAVDLGGAYLSSAEHAEQFKVMRDLIYNFGVEQNKAVVGEEIEMEEKTLKGLEKDLADLEKEDGKLDKDIKEFEAKIEENKAEISTNITNQKTKQDEIHRLEKSQIDGPLEEVADVIKGYKKELEGMMKDKKKIEKDNDGLAEKIKEAKADKVTNENNRTTKSAAITAQKETIQELRAKQAAIK